MAPTKRRGWRRDFQRCDQMDNECADGTSQHNGPLQIEYGQAQEENRQEEASIDGHGNTSQPIKKKARGPTYMKDIWALTKDDERVKVNINEFGQPIGETAGKFAEFLGTVAKNASYAPINYSRWNDMPDNKKKEIIGLVKKKFELPPGMECVILESLAIKWRNWKALLKAKYFDIKEPIEVQMEVKDVRVNKDQWGQLMTYWKSEKAQELSRRNKEIRKHKILNHRTGKKSFARVATEMKCASGRSPTRVDRFKKCYTDKAGNAKNDDVARNIAKMDKITLDLPAGACDKISRDDVFAQVTGKDRNGRVRMMGGGVAPADLWSPVPSRSTSFRQAIEHKASYEEIKSKYDATLELLKEQSVQYAEFQSWKNQQMDNREHYNSGLASAPRTCPSGPTTQSLRVNGYVAMKSVLDPSKTVAIGKLQSMDPESIVGGHVLGEKWGEVLVQGVVEGSEMLIRPYDMFQKIRDVLGCPVAWPLSLVVREEQEG